MPRQMLFTRREVEKAALELTREKGIGALSARSLGQRLGSSSKPIFSLYENMEEVRAAVIRAANEEYQRFLAEDMQAGRYPPYKASGMAYIRFAREERELFRLLFMRDRSGESHEQNDEEIEPLLDLICRNLGVDRKTARKLHLEMWIFVHGIASMIVTAYLEWDEPTVSEAVSDVYHGLIGRLCAGKEKNHA